MKVVETRFTELSSLSAPYSITQRKLADPTCPAGVASPRHDMRPTVASLELPRTVLLAHSVRIADMSDFSREIQRDYSLRTVVFVILMKVGGRGGEPRLFIDLCTAPFSAPHEATRRCWPRPPDGPQFRNGTPTVCHYRFYRDIELVDVNTVRSM